MFAKVMAENLRARLGDRTSPSTVQLYTDALRMLNELWDSPWHPAASGTQAFASRASF